MLDLAFLELYKEESLFIGYLIFDRFYVIKNIIKENHTNTNKIVNQIKRMATSIKDIQKENLRFYKEIILKKENKKRTTH